MKIEKLEVVKHGIEHEHNGIKVLTIKGTELEIEAIVEKINEIIDYLNDKKDQLL